MVFEPQGAFEVEIVGGLVEQQDVRLGEQRRGERDAHAPAAGEFCAGALLVGMGEAEPGEDRGGARRRRMGSDVGEPRLDVGDAMRVGRGFRLGDEEAALAVAGEHDLDQAFRPVRGFLGQPADGRAGGPGEAALLDREIADNGSKQGALAGAVAADQADPGTGGNLRRRPLDQEPAGHAYRNIVDHQHGRGMAAMAAGMQPVRRIPKAWILKAWVLKAWSRGMGCQDPAARATIASTAASGRATAENRGMTCA